MKISVVLPQQNFMEFEIDENEKFSCDCFAKDDDENDDLKYEIMWSKSRSQNALGETMDLHQSIIVSYCLAISKIIYCIECSLCYLMKTHFILENSISIMFIYTYIYNSKLKVFFEVRKL